MPFPQFQPIRPVRIRAPFSDPEFVYELKYGRGLACFEHGICRFVSKNGNTFTRFDALAARVGTLPGIHTAVLDAEICCLDEHGRPCFMRLMRRSEPQTYCAFDILYLNGVDLRSLPMIEGKRIVRNILSPDGPVLYVQPLCPRRSRIVPGCLLF